MRYVTKQTVLLINRIIQAEFGGYFASPNNVQNEPALDYILTAIENPVFGHEVYPSLFDKASGLLCAIVKEHIFFDGNKRTGIEVARLFLAKNGTTLITSNQDADFIVSVAACEADRFSMADWLRTRSTTRSTPPAG